MRRVKQGGEEGENRSKMQCNKFASSLQCQCKGQMAKNEPVFVYATGLRRMQGG